MTAERALYHIKAIAKERGFNIGDTEARIARNIVHYIEAKKDRHFIVKQENR